MLEEAVLAAAVGRLFEGRGFVVGCAPRGGKEGGAATIELYMRAV